MTAIPEPTEEDLEELADLEDAYDWATGDGGNHRGDEDAAKFIRILSHFQRENERLVSELKSALADSERIDHIEKQARPLHTLEERSKWVQLRWDQTKDTPPSHRREEEGMTPKEMKVWIENLEGYGNEEFVKIRVKTLKSLNDQIQRLAAIEGAGDEEVDCACKTVQKSLVHDATDESRTDSFTAAGYLRDIAKSRNQVIAELRAKLKESLKYLEFARTNCAAFDHDGFDNIEMWPFLDEAKEFIQKLEGEVGGE